MTLPSEDAILRLNHSSDLGFDAARRVLKEVYEIDVTPLLGQIKELKDGIRYCDDSFLELMAKYAQLIAQLTEARLLLMGVQRGGGTESWNRAATDFLWRTAPKEDKCAKENKE